MFENFLSKSSAIVKLQPIPILPWKTSWFTGTFEVFILGLKCHKTYFAENLWVAASNVSLFTFSLFLDFVNRAEGISVTSG